MTRASAKSSARKSGAGRKRIFAVIGDPVAHSLSPVMHNAAFKTLGINAEYRAIPVKTGQLKSFLKQLRSGKISGVNVTIPHKQDVVPMLNSVDPDIQRIATVNTIIVENFKLVGHNTDGAGYVRALKEQKKIDVSKRRLTILGAGGAAVAIAYALCRERVKSVTILNRDPARVEVLAKGLKRAYPRMPVNSGRLDNPEPGIFRNTDLLVNATALGLSGNPWSNLDFLAWLPPEAVVSDIVYNPMQTELLAKAEHLGLSVHPGYGMLLYQGALSFKLFTGMEAPLAVMEQALLKALEKK